MNKTAALIAALAITTAAHADNWTGQDKTLHLGAGIFVGSTVTLLTKNENAGFIAGALAGLAKEAYDDRHREAHTVSAKDFAVTAIGAFLGSRATGWFITPRTVTYRKVF